MKAQRKPFTIGGTAQGIRIRNLVTFDSPIRCSLMTSAMASPITTSSDTEMTTKSAVFPSDFQNTGSVNSSM